MEDIFEVQDEIARAITEQLKLTLGCRRQAIDEKPRGLRALSERPSLMASTVAGFSAHGHSGFEEAIQLDPGYALAYAGLSTVTESCASTDGFRRTRASHRLRQP